MVPNAVEKNAENYIRQSRVHERYRRQTTEGRQHIANVNVSSRSLTKKARLLRPRMTHSAGYIENIRQSLQFLRRTSIGLQCRWCRSPWHRRWRPEAVSGSLRFDTNRALGSRDALPFRGIPPMHNLGNSAAVEIKFRWSRCEQWTI